MSETLFISDLHLSPEHPETIDLFLRFLAERANQADSLYILGDLFDAWIGDDFNQPPIPELLASIRQLSDQGVELYFMHGNRDFLIGEGFATNTGCRLLNDPTVIDLYGTPTLLMHGDLLCTDDIEYQKARIMLRNPAFIAQLLSKSIPERLAIAADYRKQSGEAISNKAADIMDVNQQAVEQMMIKQGVARLIHGHTHRPDCHDFDLQGEPAQRMVLPEWHEDSAGFLSATAKGIISGHLT
ncbi:MAG: UDP-2,3-diacylglucosamine diphosphatase [Gammaproteobacteria bacterium]|nr:UDP-2,3-diacylglucosamine diphosphatase [Gammaproteobacteria bacterium]